MLPDYGFVVLGQPFQIRQRPERQPDPVRSVCALFLSPIRLPSGHARSLRKGKLAARSASFRAQAQIDTDDTDVIDAGKRAGDGQPMRLQHFYKPGEVDGLARS